MAGKAPFRKNILEYSFKISIQGNLTVIHLDEYNLTLRIGNVKETIAYASITSVRINKSSDNTFRIYMDVDDHPVITVPSWSYSPLGKRENQSGAYLLFVRVLHHHLKDKSQANFKAGKNLNRMGQWALVSALTSVIISIIAEYLGLGFMNPYLQSLILSMLAMIVIFVFSLNKLPKTYSPSNIPLQFLP